jgi:predicted nucleotidyltransferase
VPSPAQARLDALVERLRPLHPRKIVLFGSAARRDADELSDLDVVVVAEEMPRRFLDRIARAYELLEPRYALDILLYTPDEYDTMRADGNPLIAAVEREGRVLYERSAA